LFPLFVVEVGGNEEGEKEKSDGCSVHQSGVEVGAEESVEKIFYVGVRELLLAEAPLDLPVPIGAGTVAPAVPYPKTEP